MSTPSLLNIPYLYKAGTLYSQIPESGAGDFTVSRTTTVANRSTRINKDGFIETVLDNVPRLDYPLGGAVNGCPALLVEPSARNFFFPSDDFANGITAPSSFGLNNFGSGSVSNTTATLDPFGTNLADYIQENTTASIEHRALFTGTSGMVSGTTYTASIFAKSAQRTRFRLYNNAGGGGNASFDLSNGTITAQSGIPAGASPRIENYGNGWFRCSVPFTPTASGNFNVIGGLLDASGNTTYNGTGTDGLYIFGLQMEVGSVPTSYIPTTTAAVTRSADVIRKTGITSLIGQSEGTVYFEVEVTAEARTRWVATIDSGNNDFIQFFINSSRALGVSISKAGATVMTTLSSSALSVGYHKVAFAYNTATNGCEMFIDGVQNPVASRTITGAGLPALSNSTLGSFTTSNSDSLKGHIRAGSLYPTRLTNAQLATLTAL